RRARRRRRSSVRERHRAQGESCAPARAGGLGYEHARAALDLLELDLDAALVVPREREAAFGDDLLDDRVALLAVVPAEDAVAAGLQVELDVVREPLLELLGIRQRFPNLLDRSLEHDLARHLHDRLLSRATSWLHI